MDIPVDSDEACHVDKQIFETIYYGALEMSNELSKKRLLSMKTVYNSCTISLRTRATSTTPPHS